MGAWKQFFAKISYEHRKDAFIPVSYTHLDVYKRQVYDSFHRDDERMSALLDSFDKSLCLIYFFLGIEQRLLVLSLIHISLYLSTTSSIIVSKFTSAF